MSASNGGTIPDEITQLLAQSGVRIVVREPEDEDEDEDEEDTFGWGFGGTRRTPQAPQKWFDDVTDPVPAGKDLLQGGEFGRLGPLFESNKPQNKRKTTRQSLRASKLSPRRPVREDLTRVSLFYLFPAQSGLTNWGCSSAIGSQFKWHNWCVGIFTILLVLC